MLIWQAMHNGTKKWMTVAFARNRGLLTCIFTRFFTAQYLREAFPMQISQTVICVHTMSPFLWITFNIKSKNQRKWKGLNCLVSEMIKLNVVKALMWAQYPLISDKNCEIVCCELKKIHWSGKVIRQYYDLSFLFHLT